MKDSTGVYFDSKLNVNVRIVRADELGKLLELYRHLNPDDPDISGDKET